MEGEYDYTSQRGDARLTVCKAQPDPSAPTTMLDFARLHHHTVIYVCCDHLVAILMRVARRWYVCLKQTLGLFTYLNQPPGKPGKHIWSGFIVYPPQATTTTGHRSLKTYAETAELPQCRQKAQRHSAEPLPAIADAQGMDFVPVYRKLGFSLLFRQMALEELGLNSFCEDYEDADSQPYSLVRLTGRRSMGTTR